MRVYLVGKHGGRTAFKITTSRVLSDLTPLFDEVLPKIENIKVYENEKSYYVLSYILLGEYNIYYCELDDVENRAKKANHQIIEEAAKDYMRDNLSKFIEVWKKRKDLERRNR